MVLTFVCVTEETCTFKYVVSV